MVYSSDMTLTSCYSMAPIVTTTTITMTSPATSMASLPLSIYGAILVNFVEDTQAYTTVDII
jgi:hypothetical protein